MIVLSWRVQREDLLKKLTSHPLLWASQCDPAKAKERGMAGRNSLLGWASIHRGEARALSVSWLGQRKLEKRRLPDLGAKKPRAPYQPNGALSQRCETQSLNYWEPVRGGKRRTLCPESVKLRVAETGQGFGFRRPQASFEKQWGCCMGRGQ